MRLGKAVEVCSTAFPNLISIRPRLTAPSNAVPKKLLHTYHKCIRQFQDFGYIHYVPFFNPFAKTAVHLDGQDLIYTFEALGPSCCVTYLNVSSSAQDIFSDFATLFSVLILE
jgi:hypothetical protein